MNVISVDAYNGRERRRLKAEKIILEKTIL